MSNKIIFIVLGLFSLLSGFIIYILFRENTYIALVTEKFVSLAFFRQHLNMYSSDFLKYYFVDFLWAFSLCCFLYAIYSTNLKKCIVYTIIVLFLGAIWEILQTINFVNGTGDIWDIIMYLIACMTAIIIKIKRSKKNEKT